MLICPVCGKALQIEEKRAFCEAGHSFDRAKEGYFNLLLSASSGGHGDDKAMLLARRAFLEKGYYSHLCKALTELCLSLFDSGATLVDAGCGEGYYTDAVRRAFEKEGKEVKLFAFDIAKDAARLVAKKLGKESTVFVGSSYHVPMETASCDGVLSLFAPFSREEYLRILKPGGVLIRAYPLEEHLFSLKKAVYDTPMKNEAVSRVGEGWSEVEERRVQKRITLPCKEDLQALFAMTPYAHKTSPRDREKLESLTSLDVETDFGLSFYRKKL